MSDCRFSIDDCRLTEKRGRMRIAGSFSDCALIDGRSSSDLADVDYFPWLDRAYGLADCFLDRFVMSDAVSGDVDDHDSKSEPGKVVLVLKPLVDRQEHFAPSAQAFNQDVVGKASPSQAQHGEYLVFSFQETLHAGVYAFIQDDAHRLTGRRATRPVVLAPKQGVLSPVHASHWGNQQERRPECPPRRHSRERFERAHGYRQSTVCRALYRDLLGQSHRGSTFVQRSFRHQNKTKWHLPASPIVEKCVDACYLLR